MVPWPAASIRVIVLLGAALPAGCKAEPPGFGDGGKSATQWPYASYAYAVCKPAGACPGLSCARNAVGPPDGKTYVDLARCPTLELVFFGGIIRTVTGSADLALHVGTTGGMTRIEASEWGTTYELVGFVGALPAGTSTACLAEASGTRVSIYLDRCATIDNVQYLRLTRDSSVQGSLTVDAAEALSFLSPR